MTPVTPKRKKIIVVTSQNRIEKNVNDALLGMTVAILVCAVALFFGMFFGRC
jgi:hypothetical protein